MAQFEPRSLFVVPGSGDRDPLSEERHKRRTLKQLLDQQTNINDALRDENDCLQGQQRALLSLLQEKDKQLALLKEQQPEEYGSRRQAERRSPAVAEERGNTTTMEGCYRVHDIIKMQMVRAFRDFRIALLERERQDILVQLEKTKGEAEKERRLMAYQQFEMAMQHFGKQFETMRRRKLFASLQRIMLYSTRRLGGMKVAAHCVSFFVKRRILSTLSSISRSACENRVASAAQTHQEADLTLIKFREGGRAVFSGLQTALRGRYSAFLRLVISRETKEVPASPPAPAPAPPSPQFPREAALSPRAKEEEAKLDRESKREGALRKTMSRSMARKALEERQRTFAFWIRWRHLTQMHEATARAAKETEQRVDKISRISKQILVLSKLVSICDSSLKVLKVGSFHQLLDSALAAAKTKAETERKANSDREQAATRFAAKIGGVVLRRECAKAAFYRLRSAVCSFAKSQPTEQEVEAKNEEAEKLRAALDSAGNRSVRLAVLALGGIMEEKLHSAARNALRTLSHHSESQQKLELRAKLFCLALRHPITSHLANSFAAYHMRASILGVAVDYEEKLRAGDSALSEMKRKLQELQERYGHMSANCDRAMAEAETAGNLRTEHDGCSKRIGDLERQLLDAGNSRLELLNTNSRISKEKEILLGQIKELESQMPAASASRMKSPHGGNVSLSTSSFRDRSMARYEETILEMNKMTSEKVALNTRINEKDEEILRLTKAKHELEDMLQEKTGKTAQCMSEVLQLQNESDSLRRENQGLRRELADLGTRCSMLQDTIKQQSDDISTTRLQNDKLLATNKELEMGPRVDQLESELDERKKSAVALANTIDSLAADKQTLVEQLEKAAEDMRLLRDNYAKQQELTQLLKEQNTVQESEMKKLHARTVDGLAGYKTRLAELERENQTLQSEAEASAKKPVRGKKSTTGGKKAATSELRQSAGQFRDANQRLQKSLVDKNEQIDKLKQQVAELTKELVDSSRTIAEYQSKEKELEERARKLGIEKTKMQEKLSIIEQETALQQKESDSILQTGQRSKQERAAMENLNARLKAEIGRLEQENAMIRENRVGMAEYNMLKADYESVRTRMMKYDDEVTGLQRRVKEAEMERDRLRKEVEEHKKLLEQRKADIQKFHVEMENYAKILETLEKNMAKMQTEKERAEGERNKAVDEVTAIRKRYMNILGVEALPQ